MDVRNTKELLEQAMKDCLDRADVCPVESDDYIRLMEEARLYGETISKMNQTEYERETELQKLEEEKKKNRWRMILDWIGIGTSVLIPFGKLLIYRKMQIEQTINLCNFEKTGMFTTYAGKELGRNSVRLPMPE